MVSGFFTFSSIFLRPLFPILSKKNNIPYELNLDVEIVNSYAHVAIPVQTHTYICCVITLHKDTTDLAVILSMVCVSSSVHSSALLQLVLMCIQLLDLIPCLRFHEAQPSKLTSETQDAHITACLLA